MSRPARCTNASARRPDPKTAAPCRRTPPSPTLRPPTRARPRRRDADGPLRHLEPAPQSANGANATAPYRFLASRGHGPTDPVLGANPSSEGTDPFCRLPLPTLMPSTRGCTPWRPAADGGYGPTRELRKPDPDFPGPPKAHRTPPEPRRSTGTFFRISGRADSTDTVLYEEERENSSRGSRRRLRARLRHRGFAREATRRHRHCCQQRRHPPRALSESGFGNINPIPFRRKAGRSTTNECDRLTDPAPFGKTFACVLGPTDPCSTAVGTEPFSTSVFEGLVRIFATTTEICTRGRLHPGSRPRLPCSPRRPPTRRGIGQARASFSSAQALLAATVRHRSVAPAPSIFGAADSDFRGHRPAVYIDRHPFGDLMGVALGTLAGRLVHPTAPVLLTKSGPLGTRIRFCRRRDDEGGREVGRLRIRESRPVPPVPSSRVGRGRERPRGLQSFALPDGIATIERQLS
ncbi:unnamed protein product [Acanthosepion pharaonis]|uniref:Uncharacterized protein n=1 Tax=Acanthosepion pharaonis TaxID=158019 RepID=A0A812B4F3_ACAPH|nr:unnamed protein product [Sepia pharaonis]